MVASELPGVDPGKIHLRRVGEGRWCATVQTAEGPITVDSDSKEDLLEYAAMANSLTSNG